MLVIVDYGIGNVGSIANMLKRIGVAAITSSRDRDIERATHLILPGVGAFDACLSSLGQTGLLPCLEQRVLGDGVPLLGICVGAQMLGYYSDEGRRTGLGWLNLEVKRFPIMRNLPIPHMGWNSLSAVRRCHPIASNSSPIARFYFAHSFYMLPSDRNDWLFSAKYGIEFAAAVASRNIVAVQFHPEKSHRFGKALFKAFAEWET